MHLLHLIPAGLCLFAACMLGVTMRDDLATATLHWRDRETAAGAAYIAACLTGAAISLAGALGVFAR